MKPMTVARLKKQLDQLIAEGHGRKYVVIDKMTFTHPLEGDGYCMMNVRGLSVESFNVADDDGGLAVRKDGSERFMTTALLTGANNPPIELDCCQPRPGRRTRRCWRG